MISLERAKLKIKKRKKRRRLTTRTWNELRSKELNLIGSSLIEKERASLMNFLKLTIWIFLGTTSLRTSSCYSGLKSRLTSFTSSSLHLWFTSFHSSFTPFGLWRKSRMKLSKDHDQHHMCMNGSILHLLYWILCSYSSLDMLKQGNFGSIKWTTSSHFGISSIWLLLFWTL